ncbi:VOC family protein [Phenylobacterium sp.]|uniref:VOC family protein n=1 Tax=Phenylobacterium sp. TaxID=1871053 RepID=UPI00286A3028|nr:VOC family protein [Phenylobacterium sp.]
MRVDGKIDYVELPGVDLPATKGFYARAFGWTFTDYGPSYTAFDNGGLDGGFNADPEDRAAAPLVILFATDLEAMEARVKAAGGSVTRPIYSFPGGRRFHFRDPSGNELAVFSEA